MASGPRDDDKLLLLINIPLLNIFKLKVSNCLHSRKIFRKMMDKLVLDTLVRGKQVCMLVSGNKDFQQPE
jgi:hypothetical protein